MSGCVCHPPRPGYLGSFSWALKTRTVKEVCVCGGGTGQGSRVRRSSWGVGEANLGKRKQPQMHWWVSLWGSHSLGLLCLTLQEMRGEGRDGEEGEPGWGRGQGWAPSLLHSTSFLLFFNLRASFSRSCHFTYTSHGGTSILTAKISVSHQRLHQGSDSPPCPALGP